MVDQSKVIEIAIKFLLQKGFKTTFVNISSTSGGRWLVMCKIDDCEDVLIVSVDPVNCNTYILD